MSDSDKALLAGIRAIVMLAVLIAMAINIVVIAVQSAWLLGKIHENKCGCDSVHGQVHQQHVNVAPQWSREDTIREELKRRLEKQE